MLFLGQFYCSSPGTIVSAQYGGLCGLFAPTAPVSWLSAVCLQFLLNLRGSEGFQKNY